MADICDDCLFCKEKSGGRGKCKVEHAEIHIVGLSNTTSREDDWPIVNVNSEACGQYARA